VNLPAGFPATRLPDQTLQLLSGFRNPAGCRGRAISPGPIVSALHPEFLDAEPDTVQFVPRLSGARHLVRADGTGVEVARWEGPTGRPAADAPDENSALTPPPARTLSQQLRNCRAEESYADGRRNSSLHEVIRRRRQAAPGGYGGGSLHPSRVDRLGCS
jgi:hypothetical protein